jgi:predicted O-methyltransferase YrrM
MFLQSASLQKRSIMDLKNWDEHASELGEVHRLVRDLCVSHTQCGSPEPEFLFSLAYSLQDRGEIVEIGTNVGTTLLMFASAQKLKRSKRRVNTIDIHPQDSLTANIARVDLSTYVNVIVARSADVAITWNKPIEMLFIDGDHSYEGCLSDIEHWGRFVIKDGYLVFHDFADGMGVPRAVHEAILSRPWLYRVLSDREFGSIFVVRKIADQGSITAWTDRMSPIAPEPSLRIKVPKSRLLLRKATERIGHWFRR